MIRLYTMAILAALLAAACDTPPEMPIRQAEAPEKVEENLDSEDPEALLAAYFEHLKTRDNRALDKMMAYPQLHFYKKEPQPITHWELLHRAELTSEDADKYDIKPNPIQDDLLLKVKIWTVDEYKKTGYFVDYFMRETHNKWQFVNRLSSDSVVAISLKYGENALNFKEYEVWQQTEDHYLVKIKPHLLISVNEKAQVVDKIEAAVGEELSWEAPSSILNTGEKWATWDASGRFSLIK